MPLDERIRRWRRMKAVVDEQDVVWWRQRFTEVLMGEQAAAPQEQRAPAYSK